MRPTLKVRPLRLAANKWQVKARLAADYYARRVIVSRMYHHFPFYDETAAAATFSRKVKSAVDAYKRGFAPYRRILQRLRLPKRYPKGDPRNIRRSQMVASALRREKLRRLGKKRVAAQRERSRRATLREIGKRNA